MVDSFVEENGGGGAEPSETEQGRVSPVVCSIVYARLRSVTFVLGP